MGLLRMAARTAVVAGIATAARPRATSSGQQGPVAHQQQYAQEPQDAQQAPPAPEDADSTAQLQNPAALHTQGAHRDESSQQPRPRSSESDRDAEAQRGTSPTLQVLGYQVILEHSPHDGDSPFRMGQFRVRWVQARRDESRTPIVSVIWLPTAGGR